MLLLAALLLMSSSLSQAQESNFKPQEVAVVDGTVWKAQVENGDVDQFTLFRAVDQATIEQEMLDTVVLIPPGVSFLNLSNDLWYAMSRYRLEIAVSNTRSLAHCEKLLKEADKRDNRNLWGNRIRDGIIVGLAAAYVLK